MIKNIFGHYINVNNILNIEDVSAMYVNDASKVILGYDGRGVSLGVLVIGKTPCDIALEINKQLNTITKRLHLKPMSELEKLIEEGNTSYHDGSMIYAVLKGAKCGFASWIDGRSLSHEQENNIPFYLFKGWIDLSELPSDVKDI